MKIPLQRILDLSISSCGITLHVLRLDRIHPEISGNKFFKLKYNLEEARKQNKKCILTFGGAFSNHIAAVAAAGKEFGFRTVGVIRGDELAPEDNQTLGTAKANGMELHFVSREEYRKKESENFRKDLEQQFGDFYFLPEGGTNDLATKGCAEITSLIDIPFDVVCCPVGTGSTLAGIQASLDGGRKAIGFSVLKGMTSKAFENFEIMPDYHFGGYAKHTPELLNFIADFKKQNGIPLEQVYTGKMMFGIYDLIKKGYFPRNSTVIAVHTGGLQGQLH